MKAVEKALNSIQKLSRNDRIKSATIGQNILEVEVVNISRHGFWVFVRGKEYFLTFEKFPWFKNATVKSILNVQLLHQHDLHWPDLDVDLELDSIENHEKYPLIYKG